MRQIVIAAAVSCASVCGQSAPATDVFTKAPPQVDAALRERISGFYQKHIEGKFRAAEQFVAQDSLDLFYESDKTRYLGFEIVKIDYTDNYTKAVVVTAVELDWRTARLGTIRVKPPLTSTWKVDDGKWCWYTVPRKDWDSPWGKMNPGPDNPANKTNAMAAAFKEITPEALQSRVRVSKASATLSGFEKSHDAIDVTNGLGGEIRLQLNATAVPGLKVVADKTVLKGGEVAHLTFDYDPPVKGARANALADLRIEPMGQTISLPIVFAVSKELQERLKQANLPVK